jgi:DHA1 family bicyclomycin/chloramphenicol resistance-like MFS transporter
LVVFRLIQAFGVCCAPVAARAVIRDLYELREAARMLSYVSSAFSLTPVLAPAVGAVIDETFGWRANFLFMVAAGGVILAAALAWLPETAPKRRPPVLPSLIVASYVSLVRHRTFLGYSLLVTFAFVPFFVFNSVAPFYLIQETGLTPTEFALPYSTIALWFGLSAFIAARITHRFGIDRTILGGTLVCVAGAALEAGFVFAGVSAVWALCGAMSVYSFGAGFVFPNSQAGAVAPFPDRAGSASALNGFMQMTLAALLGVLAMQIYDGSAIPMAIFVIVFAAAAVPPYVLLILRRRPPPALSRTDG